ncbi:hypothetical protein [Paenibacillus agricola]|uniref:Uncharacterized protein n=1 Tax=Paenibacillus agricola TaxID=2716264 RepID=A0ABX0JCP4_9BACL|nr:hypothetical protein [Paenibacillus agricola]NHN33333.1 hypothetical protein [Paenibacillus agricola]
MKERKGQLIKGDFNRLPSYKEQLEEIMKKVEQHDQSMAKAKKTINDILNKKN